MHNAPIRDCSTQGLKLSRYVVAAPPFVGQGYDEPMRAVLSTRSGEALVVPAWAWSQLEQGRAATLPGPLLQQLRDADFVVPLDEDELAAVLAENDLASATDELCYFVVQPTAACQLGCGYCGQEHTSTRMCAAHQSAVADRLAERLAGGGYRHLHIGWFGAEPLIAMSVIRSLTPQLRAVAEAHGCTYGAKLVTNGLLLTPDVARELAEVHSVGHIEVTLDGTRAFHDRRRHFKSGAPSFERILRNVADVVGAGIDLQISLRCNVDRSNVDGVVPLIELIAALGLQDRVSFYAAKVHSWGNDAHLGSFAPDEFAALEVGWLVRQIELGFDPALLPCRKKIVCMSTMRDGELVDAHGTVFNCTEVSYVPTYGTPNEWALGTLEEGTDDGLRDRLGGFNGRVRRGELPCTSCPMLPVCGGSCPKAWLEGNDPCPTAKYNVGQRLLIELARGRVDERPRPPVVAFEEAMAVADAAAVPTLPAGQPVQLSAPRRRRQPVSSTNEG